MSSMPIAASELEALALQCRDESFRSTLSTSGVWDRVVQAVESSLLTLGQAFCARDEAKKTKSVGVDAGECQLGEKENDDDDDDDDDGLSYSFSVGKGSGVDDVTDRGLDAASVRVSDVASALAAAEHATSAFRFARNACAASPSNQDVCREVGLLRLARDLVAKCCIWCDVDDEILQSQTTSAKEPFGYRSAIIRVIGNLCYRHKEHQDIVHIAHLKRLRVELKLLKLQFRDVVARVKIQRGSD
ncbi:hypothetical protein P43SY_006463 [Pythium insidiosum]|uniref:Uncharacterized protein n=1 Tax=Pythium insidiosum TaxID=114742 RepID=A0AAD5Q7H7_PYTIN|nr:hypothetical protein P43SY_006463 [Pythium insidiosum]